MSLNRKPSGLLDILPPPKANAFINKSATKSTITTSKTVESTTTSKNETNKLQSSSSTTPTTSLLLLKPHVLTQKQKPTTTIASSSSKSTTQSPLAPKPNPANASNQISSLTFLKYGYASDSDEDEEIDEEELKRLASKQLVNDDNDESVKPKRLKPNFDCDRKPVVEREVAANDDEPANDAEHQYDQAHSSTSVVDDEAWKKFCGANKKKKEQIEIVDVKATDLVGDVQANLMKQITGDYNPPSNRDFFSSSSKRKHQITYLAYVAKEREQELKSAWAQGKFNKMQSRMKYGF